MTWDQRSLGACVAAVALVALTPAAHADLSNGNFESGDFTGWTQTGDTSFSGVANFAANTGSFGAFFGPNGAGGISQTFATTANTTYNISFSLALLDSSQPNLFYWTWNGALQSVSFSNAAGFGYRTFSASVSSSGASSTLAFNFADPQSFWLLDNVNVTVAAVPEPQVTALWAAGLLLVAVAKRRRKTHR